MSRSLCESANEDFIREASRSALPPQSEPGCVSPWTVSTTCSTRIREIPGANAPQLADVEIRLADIEEIEIELENRTL